MLDRRAAAERFQQLVQRALLRRTREDAVATEQRGQLVPDLQHTARLARRHRRARPGERGRQCTPQRHAQRHEIVLGDPSAEREHRRVDRRLPVRRGDDVLVADAVARLGGAEHDSDLALVPERNQHPCPRLDTSAQSLGNAIAERPEQREGEGDIDEGHPGKISRSEDEFWVKRTAVLCTRYH
jgi:hypothetical protein